MVVVATLFIVLAAVGVAVAPLLRPGASSPGRQSWKRERLEELLSRRDSTYDAVRDLDFEYEIGNLSEADYRELRELYRLRAAAVLRRMDRLGAQPLQPAAHAASGGTVRPATESSQDKVCAKCARPIEAGDSFCRHCGAPLR